VLVPRPKHPVTIPMQWRGLGLSYSNLWADLWPPFSTTNVTSRNTTAVENFGLGKHNTYPVHCDSDRDGGTTSIEVHFSLESLDFCLEVLLPDINMPMYIPGLVSSIPGWHESSQLGQICNLHLFLCLRCNPTVLVNVMGTWL